jgi:membrane protease YdiL (CAAX protease family)
LPARKPAPGGFNAVFLGSSGVRAGWRAALYITLVVTFIFALQLLGTALGLPLLADPQELTPAPLVLQELILFGSGLAATALLAGMEGRSIGDYGLPWQRAFRGHFWQGTAWGFGEITVLILLIAALGGYSPGELALDGSEALRYAILWALVCLLVGLTEEFLFRGYLLATLSSGMGFWPAAFILSLLFGAVHLTNPGETLPGLIGVFAIGMFFCLTVRRTGDLWFAIGMHAAFNFGQAFVYSVPNSGTLIRGHLLDARLEGPQWLTGGSAGPEGSALTFVVMLPLFVLFSWVYPQTMRPGPWPR